MAERGGNESAKGGAARVTGAALDPAQMLAVSDALPMGVAFVDCDRRYLFVNSTLADFFGRPRKELLGRTMDEVLGDDVMDARRPIIEEALRGERRWFATEYEHPSRGKLAIQVDYLPQCDANGATIGVVILINDVTEQRIAERALKESEARFRRIADSAPVIMWVARLDRTCDFVNDAYSSFTGISRDQARGEDWIQTVHREDRDRLLAVYRASEAGAQAFEVEARFRRHDGEWRWLRCVLQPRLCRDGRLLGYIGAATDTTRAKRAEEELRAEVDARTRELADSESRVRGIFDAVMEVIVLLDPDGTVIEMNRVNADWRAHNFGDAIGGKIWDAPTLKKLPHYVEAMKQAVASAARGEEFQGEFRVQGASGRATTLEFRVRPILDSAGKVVNLLTEARDISELKEAQDQLRQAQKMEALGQLTGGMAHDFNNLLTVVVGGLDLIAKQVDDERLKRYAQNALKAAERGARLTAQLLAFSRVQRLEVQPMDANELIDEMRPLLRNVLGPGIEKQFEIADGKLGVLADPTQLEVALLNLAINARDAMPDGGTLTIAARHATIRDDPELADGHYAELSIADTGSGMPPDVLERAFEPFFTTKEVGRGTGLGLSMVYGMARQSGGVARIDSEVGSGTVVRLYLKCVNEDAIDRQDRADVVLTREPEKFSILVVDDDEDVRRFIACALEEAGHDIAEAASGHEALAAFAKARPDILVLDFLMPGMTGADVATAIREMVPDQPVLFVTGYSESDAIRAAAPDAPVLIKPFRPDALDLAVRDLMRQRKESADGSFPS